MTHGFRNRISKVVDQVLGTEGRGGGASRKETLAPLPTRNREWGFFGTVVCGQGDGISKKAAEDYTAALWTEVATWLSREFGASPAAVRAFLDSKWGRHMADAGTEPELAPGSQSRITVAEIQKAYGRPAWRRELEGQLCYFEDPTRH